MRMNLIWNNKLAAVLAGASMLAAVEFSNIYVPDNIEDKFAFRKSRLFERVGWIAARLGARFNFGTEIEIFRDFIHLLVRFAKQTSVRNPAIFITDAVADNVPIRIYSPKNLVARPNPIMFYYHGGAYCFGKLEMYDSLLTKFSSELGIVIISIGYRLAPRNAYPIPIEDCYASTFYVLNNSDDFNLNINFNKIIFSGDSAGGNIAAILSSQFIQNGKFTPSIQALIYPPTQYYSFLTPSSIQYSNLELTSRASLCLYHMGLTHVNKYQEDFLIKNYHTLLLKDPELKKKFEAYLSIDLIPEIYRNKKFYYNNYASLEELVYPSEAPEYDFTKLDPRFVLRVKNLFNLNLSPGLADDEDLKYMPNTLVMVCEHDTRKDEGLIYAERLRLAGNQVDVKYYENGYHGVITNERSTVSTRMRNDFIEFIRKNL